MSFAHEVSRRQRDPHWGRAAALVALFGLFLGGIVVTGSAGGAPKPRAGRAPALQPFPSRPRRVVLGLERIARRAVQANGDPALHQATVLLTTRARAAGGDVVDGNEPVYEIVLRGRFVCGDCSGPPGSRAPSGTVATVTVDRVTLEETDFGVSDALRPADRGATRYRLRF